MSVNSPAPQVMLTNPVAASTVSGTVPLSATATTDATQSDQPNLVTFYVDNSEVDHMDCGSSTTCAATGNWDSTGLSGQHTITVKLDTDNGLHVTSPPVLVSVNSPQKKKPPRTGHGDHPHRRQHVSGTAASATATTDATQSDPAVPGDVLRRQTGTRPPHWASTRKVLTGLSGPHHPGATPTNGLHVSTAATGEQPRVG